VKYLSHSQIEASLQIINALVSYIILQKMVYISEKPTGLQIAEYIAENISADLSVSAMCHRFAMSRSQLYLVTQTYMPQGVAKYVKKCRIDAAAAAITANPRKPLWVIAQECGFDNYEYFLRIFKKETGLSPKTKGIGK
jgi:YesN/AraC family two-component response regulator